MRGNFENPSESGEDQMSSEENKETSDVNERTKKKKPGIIYLSTIPNRMNPTCLRHLLSPYGEIGRMYLQEDVRDAKKKGRFKKPHSRNYVEAWVEFKSKRVAKEVAKHLNNTQIGGRKKSQFYDFMWTIKYLPRFKWTHLDERLAYESAVRKQRMRTEINQAKREADYFSLNVDMSERLKKKFAKGQKLMNFTENSEMSVHQRKTEDEILEKKKNKKTDSRGSGENMNNRDDFLKSLFN